MLSRLPFLSSPRISLTVIRNSQGWATKHFRLNPDGSIRKKSHAQIWEGTSTRHEVYGVQGLIDLADSLEREEAFLFGLTEQHTCRISTQGALKNGLTDAISRDRTNYAYREGEPGFIMLDHDPRPRHPRYRSDELDEILCRHIEGFTDTERAWRPSSTAFLYREKDGAQLVGLGGWRCYLAVDDASAIPALGGYIYQTLWKAGYGYITISASGQRLDKCLFDASVWQPERIDFAATPVLGPGIVRRAPEAKIIEASNPMLASERFMDTPELREWRSQSPELKAAKLAAKPEAEAVRDKFVKAKLAELKESGAPIKNAEAVYMAAIVQNELYGDFQLMTPDSKVVTVAEVLADQDRFHEARFADPLEPEYANDNRIAYVNLKAEKPYLYSHVHGGMLYRLSAEAPPIDRAPAEPPDEDEAADEAGSDDATATRASALRAILVDGLDAKAAEGRLKRQWPKLKDDIPSIVASAQRTAEKWKTGATRIIGGMLKRVTSLDAINERFVMVEVPGQPSCIAQRSDALFLTWADFRARLGDSVIVTGVNNKGAVQTQAAAVVWVGDCRHRTADKIVFTSREVAPNCLNLWTQFGTTPKAGRCRLIHRHIWEVICAKEPKKYKAFINLLAWQVQNIGYASRIIVVLYSKEQQVGKGVLLEKILPEMFGPLHGVFTDEFEHYFGRFNDGLRGKVCVCLDEACFAGDRKAGDKLKSAAATGRMSIEGKGLPKIQLPAGVNIFMSTNRAHAAHVEEHDARYWILKVSPHRKGDVAYWTELLKEIGSGGVAAFLHGLLARDVSKFVPQRDVPLRNAEHEANRRASDPANPAIWLLDCLDNGLWLGSEKWDGKYSADTGSLEKTNKSALAIDAKIETLFPAFLESSYRTWAATQGRYAQAAAKDELWGQLTEFGFAPRRNKSRRWRVVPAEDDLRAKITEHFDANSKAQKTAGDGVTANDDVFQFPLRMADKYAAAAAATTEPSISPEVAEEVTISPSLTVTKEERVYKSTDYPVTVDVTVSMTVGDGGDEKNLAPSPPLSPTATGIVIAAVTLLDDEGCSDNDAFEEVAS